VAAIEAEFCLAEGGGVDRRNGKIGAMTVMTTEKVPARHLWSSAERRDTDLFRSPITPSRVSPGRWRGFLSGSRPCG